MKYSIVFLFLLGGLAAGSQQLDVLHYDFVIGLRDDADTISGNTTIRFVKLNDDTTVVFDLASVNSKGRGMKVESLVMVKPQHGRLQYRHASDRLHIHLPSIRRGDTAEVQLIYQGIPADGLIISKNKYGDRTFFADNWPNRARHWIPCNDRPDDKASFEFRVGTPQHYQVISNGIKLGEGPSHTPYKQTIWREELPQPTKVMVIGAARFAVKTYENSPKGIPVSAWVYPQDSVKGFYDYALAPEILKFFSAYIGPYPYKKLANVQSKTIFGGMENASAIFYAETSVTGDRSSEDLLAHEIAHQWFGNMASEKSFAHLWLSEGFATYLTHVYLEKKYGAEKLRERMREDREAVIGFLKTNRKPVVDSTKNLMSLLNANSYQKGSWVLHMLRQEVGEATFQKILRKYYEQFKGGNAETRDFERVAEQVSGRELSWFFDQWLYRPGIPVLKMETKVQGNEFFLFISQQGEPYRFFLEVDIAEEDGGLIQERIEVKEKEAVLKVRIKGNSVQFAIDPQVRLLYELED